MKWIWWTIIGLSGLFLWRICLPMWEATPANTSQKKIAAKRANADTLALSTTPTDSLNFVIDLPIKSALWDTLTDIVYTQKGEFGFVPAFKPKQKRLNGQMLTVQGYMYPLQEDRSVQTWFMLSRYPVSSCFFCGAAGPETVIEVKSPQGIAKRDKPVRIRGKLTLNTSEPDRLFYILEQAELLR